MAPPTAPATSDPLAQASSNPYASIFNQTAGQVDPTILGSGTSTGLPAGQNPESPASAVSPYTFNEHVAPLPVILGQAFGAVFGMKPDQVTTIGQVVYKLYDLSPTARNRLGLMLWNAGYYVSPDGTPSQNQPQFTAVDSSMQNALSYGLLLASQSNPGKDPKGQTMSSLTAGLVQSGAGASQRQLPPSPVSAGGQTYQNLVTNASDLYSKLYSTFEATLGRAPTADEVANFQGAYQGQEQKYNQALINQSETASRARFAQAEYARNAEAAFARTPAAAGSTSGVPNGPFHTPAAWASAFLAYIGAKPTASNFSFLLSVINKMGGWANAQATKNPLGSALPSAGPAQQTGPGGPNINAAQMYNNWSQGMMMTWDALQNYPNIVSALQGGNAANPVAGQVNNLLKDLNKWSNGQITALPEPSAADRKAADAAAATATTKAPAATTVAGPEAPAATANTAPGAPLAAPAPATGHLGIEQGGAGVSAGSLPGTPPTPAEQVAPPPSTGQTPFAGTPAPADPQGSYTSGGVTYVPQPDPASPTGWAFQPENFMSAPGQRIESPGANAAAPVPPGSRPVQAAGAPEGATPAGGAVAGGTPQPWTGTTTPAADVFAGQNAYTAADTYIAPTEVTGQQMPSPEDAAFTLATTGKNALPYQANQYLHIFDVIANMISSGQVTG